MSPPPFQGIVPADKVLPPSGDVPSYCAMLRPKISPTELSPIDLRKLCRAYPNRIKIPSSCLEEGAVPWNFALVGKFLGRSLSIDSISSSLMAKWVLEKELELIPLSFGFIFFRFSCERDRDMVLIDGPWVVDDATLALELWSPNFVPSPTQLPRTILWMRLPNLPPIC